MSKSLSGTDTIEHLNKKKSNQIDKDYYAIMAFVNLLHPGIKNQIYSTFNIHLHTTVQVVIPTYQVPSSLYAKRHKKLQLCLSIHICFSLCVWHWHNPFIPIRPAFLVPSYLHSIATLLLSLLISLLTLFKLHTSVIASFFFTSVWPLLKLANCKLSKEKKRKKERREVVAPHMSFNNNGRH